MGFEVGKRLVEIRQRRIKVALGLVDEAAVEESGGIFRIELDNLGVGGERTVEVFRVSVEPTIV